MIGPITQARHKREILILILIIIIKVIIKPSKMGTFKWLLLLLLLLFRLHSTIRMEWG